MPPHIEDIVGFGLDAEVLKPYAVAGAADVTNNVIGAAWAVGLEQSDPVVEVRLLFLVVILRRPIMHGPSRLAISSDFQAPRASRLPS